MASKNVGRAARIKTPPKRMSEELTLQPHLRRLLDGIHNVCIFIKGIDGEFVFGSRSLIKRLGLRSETELLGRTDRALVPSHLAEKYRQDDLEVIGSGREKLNLIEMFKNEQGLLQWFVTHKYPIVDASGKVIGIVGSIQEYGRMSGPIGTHGGGILVAAQHILRNYRNPISIRELSKLGGMPVRRFQRKFKLVFDASPREYILRHRLRYACEALRNTRKAIAKICLEAGFYDQSSFTRQFTKYMNVTPLRYRKGGSVAQ
jgi:PAS domain S-box-containing protein